MINLRKATERGQANIDWLKSYHSFSFGDYYDPNNMGYHSLRVINEDYVAPAKGFGRHPHKNMEIITLVLSGELRHEDSLGSSSVIDKTMIQKMSAGRGIIHSEFNNSNTEDVHLYQIWITPSEMGIEPSYEEVLIDEKSNHIYLAGAKEEGALVSLKQDAKLHLYKIDSGKTEQRKLSSGRHYWYQVLTGQGDVNGVGIQEGDGFSVEGELGVTIAAGHDLSLLEFDLN